jgi:hypothetical protein
MSMTSAAEAKTQAVSPELMGEAGETATGAVAAAAMVAVCWAKAPAAAKKDRKGSDLTAVLTRLLGVEYITTTSRYPHQGLDWRDVRARFMPS